jgi:hypothetical protein
MLMFLFGESPSIVARTSPSTGFREFTLTNLLPVKRFETAAFNDTVAAAILANNEPKNERRVELIS